MDFHGINFISSVLKHNPVIPKFNFCGSNNNQYVFDCFGNIYTCWWGTNNSEFIVGDISRLDYKKIDQWNNTYVNTIDNCKVCKYKYICGAGCSYKASLNKGSAFAGNCSDFKQIIKMYLNYVFEDMANRNSYFPLNEKLTNMKLDLLNQLVSEYGAIEVYVTGNSMAELSEGYVTIESISNKNVSEGDIILYQKKEGFLVLHAIEKIKDNWILVKGSNEDYFEKIQYSDLVGRYSPKKIENIYNEKRQFYYEDSDFKLVMEVQNHRLQNIKVEKNEHY